MLKGSAYRLAILPKRKLTVPEFTTYHQEIYYTEEKELNIDQGTAVLHIPECDGMQYYSTNTSNLCHVQMTEWDRGVEYRKR